MIRNFAITFLLFLSLIKVISATELTHQGLGEIHFGKALSSMQLPYKALSQEVEGCQYIMFDRYPSLSVMVVDDIIHRIEASDLSLIERSHPFYQLVNQSQSLSDFKVTYPNIEIEEHEYETGLYLRWYNHEETRAIVVDYINGKVELIKAGLIPAALWVEGCA